MNADTDRNIALPSPPSSDVDAIDFLLKQMGRSHNNREFFQQMVQG